MNWTQISDYCLQAEGWRIAKSLIRQRPRYTAFQMPGQVLCGVFDSADEAKAYCERFRRAA